MVYVASGPVLIVLYYFINTEVSTSLRYLSTHGSTPLVLLEPISSKNIHLILLASRSRCVRSVCYRNNSLEKPSLMVSAMA
jgi:hypothetical protein